MSVKKRARGATVIHNKRTSLSELPLPHKQMLAGIAAGLILIIASFTLFTDEATEPKADLAEVPAAPPVEQAIAIPDTVEDTPPQAPVPVAPQEQPWLDQVVKNGDNLSLIFKRAGYSDREVHDLVSQAEEGKSLTRIFPGQVIAFKANETGGLTAVRHIRSPLETAIYTRGDAGFESMVVTRTPELREAWTTGVITSSLFMAGQKAGLSQNMIMEMANIFGGVIDFVQDPRKGDTIQLIYEDLYLDGEKYKDGEIVAASFTNQGKTFNAFRYEDASGDIGYFSEDGVSMRKAFLLAPVDFTRISSNFNMRRLHPIYKTTRPHRGTDYAAPRGTPVFAAGDGRVYKAGYTKANGNYVFIQHGEQYITKYLHLHKRKVKKGQRVSQSQVIGTVGSTGAATGPHLHYEFLLNGVHRNPRTIHKKLPKAKTLPAGEMDRFREAINKASTQLAALRSDNQLAMRDTTSTSAAQ